MGLTRIPVIKAQLVAAAAAMFSESLERPEDAEGLALVARLVDEALLLLDLHGRDVREEPCDWQAA